MFINLSPQHDFTMRCFASKQCYITAFSVLVKFLDSLIFPEVEDKTYTDGWELSGLKTSRRESAAGGGRGKAITSRDHTHYSSALKL